VVATRPTLVEQVRNALVADLLDGTLQAGEQLPNEDELGRRFSVSRATVREAVRGLLEVGYLSREHGRGTFVTGLPRHGHSLDMTVSYTAMIRDAGMEPGERLIDQADVPATEEEAKALGIGTGDAVVRIERVRMANSIPVIYSIDRIPTALLRPEEQVPATSLYTFLADAGFPVHHAVAVLRPDIATREIGGLLQIEPGSPLMRIEQTDFTIAGRPVMISSEWHVPDVFELRVNRRPLAAERRR